MPGGLALRSEMISAHSAVSQVFVGAFCDPALHHFFGQIPVREIHEPAVSATLGSVAAQRQFTDFVPEPLKDASNTLVNALLMPGRARIVDGHSEGLHSSAVG